MTPADKIKNQISEINALCLRNVKSKASKSNQLAVTIYRLMYFTPVLQ
jgi:hypothetical protein